MEILDTIFLGVIGFLLFFVLRHLTDINKQLSRLDHVERILNKIYEKNETPLH